MFRPPTASERADLDFQARLQDFKQQAQQAAQASRQGDLTALARAYRAAEQLTGSTCPIEAGFIGQLADNECRHGRLPGDRTPACGCWGQR